MIAPPLNRPPIVEDWLLRHARPVNFTLHIIGIPLTIMGMLLMPVYVVMLSLPIFAFSLSLFVVGYMIQFLGHALEGTEPGEIFYLRRKITHFIRKRMRKAIAATVPQQQTPGPVA